MSEDEELREFVEDTISPTTPILGNKGISLRSILYEWVYFISSAFIQFIAIACIFILVYFLYILVETMPWLKTNIIFVADSIGYPIWTWVLQIFIIVTYISASSKGNSTILGSLFTVFMSIGSILLCIGLAILSIYSYTPISINSYIIYVIIIGVIWALSLIISIILRIVSKNKPVYSILSNSYIWLLLIFLVLLLYVSIFYIYLVDFMQKSTVFFMGIVLGLIIFTTLLELSGVDKLTEKTILERLRIAYVIIFINVINVISFPTLLNKYSIGIAHFAPIWENLFNACCSVNKNKK